MNSAIKSCGRSIKPILLAIAAGVLALSLTVIGLSWSRGHNGVSGYDEMVGSPGKVFASNGRVFHVAPDGKPNAAGTSASPLDLATALDGKRMSGLIKPGDSVSLRGGVYTGAFTSTLSGTAELPIYVRGEPGERVVIDKNSAARETGGLAVRGEHVWFMNLEIANSFPDRNRLDGDGEMNPWRGSGINVYAPNTKYINLIVHDNGHGFGLWNEEGGTEIYGCVIFNNGNNKKEHGIYAHNRNGTQVIRDNIIFNGAGYGIHIYANSKKSSISGFEIEGNAVFNNGALVGDDQVADQILVGGVDGVGADRITLRDNYVYNDPSAPTAKNRGIRLGYEDENNNSVGLFDNYIVSRVPLKISWWKSIEGRGNTIVSSGKDVEINGNHAGENNWRPAAFRDKASLGNLETKVFIRANKYEPGKANIVVYNWKMAERVSVDLSGVLKRGERFEVLDAQNYLGRPVVRAEYNGKSVDLPLRLGEAGRPVGNVERVPPHTSPQFAVFVIRRING